MSISKKFSEFIMETNLGDIPPETMKFTKELALKTVAGMLAGSITLAGRKITNFIRNQGGPAEASVIGCGFRSSVENASFANGVFAHAAELEDDQFPSATSDITIFPVIFPLADKLRLTGREIIEAAAISMEVMNRAGMFSLAHKGITDLPFYGILGATVAAARILGLNAQEIHSALGIAIGRASGFIVNFGTDAHYFESAIACKDGLLAALWAKEGMTGNGDIEKWLTALFGPGAVNFAKITENLGRPPWHVHNLWIKKYPCCFLTHRQIDATLALLKENKLTYPAIERIDLEVGPVDSTCDRPNPKDIEDSRFSFQHILGGLILEGGLSYDTFTNDKIVHPAFKEARSKIKVHVHADWPAQFQSGVAKIEITQKNGRVISKEMEQPLGGAKLPLTTDQFRELYKKYAKGLLTEEQLEWTANIILNLEQYKDLQEFMDVLTYRYALRR
jgi:2-methylcitrate dehydratase PrpD